MANTTVFSLNNNVDAREVSMVDDGTNVFVGIGTRTPTQSLHIVAPSGAAGSAGYGFIWGTGAGGSNSPGGDVAINLGAGTGSKRSGQVQITSSSTFDDGSQYNAALMVTETLTPSGVLTGNRQGLSILFTTAGAAANYNGANAAVGISAIESRHVCQIAGHVTPLLYGSEFQWILGGAGTADQATVVQADLSSNAASSGTLASGSGFRAVIGPVLGTATFTVASAFSANTDLRTGQSGISVVNGFQSLILSGIFGNTDTAPSYVIRGVWVPIPVQGGNTSGTDDNIGVHVAVASISGSGGGLAAAGGTVRNRGIVIDMPTAQAVAGANINYGIDITGTIGGNDGNNTTYATHQDIRWNAGVGANTQIANRWTISANAANTGRLENFRLESTMNSNGNTVATWWDLVVNVPTYTAGTVTSKIGFVSRNQGHASATGVAGIAIEDQTTSSKFVNLLLGTTTIPTGTWSLYSSSANASSILGSLAVGSNTAAAAATLLSVTPTATVTSATSAIWDGISVPATTLTLSGSTAITTAAGVNLITIAQPSLSAASALTVTNAASLTILNAPTGIGAGPATITNAYALWVQAGLTKVATLATTGLATMYNAVATAGWGLPAIYTDTRPGTKTNVTTTIATYTVGAADGTFMVCCNVNVTVSTTVTMTVTLTYSDETNTSRVLTVPFFLLAGTLVQSITTAQGNIAYESVPIYIRCKTGTTITLATAGTVTAVTYTSEGSIIQVA